MLTTGAVRGLGSIAECCMATRSAMYCFLQKGSFASSSSSTGGETSATSVKSAASLDTSAAPPTGPPASSSPGADSSSTPASSPASPSSLPGDGKGFSIMNHITDIHNKDPLKSATYASSVDDMFGVQKNWFTALYKQLNYAAKTGQAPQLAGRQRLVFEAVEAEFEMLYGRYIAGQNLEQGTHRAMLMVCLATATHRILIDEIGEPTAVRDIIRTNLGSVMISLLLPLHRARIWVLRRLLGEDPYRQAVKLLPAIQEDMGSLCSSVVEDTGPEETTLTINSCMYHDVLTKEDAPFLLSEFCCHHALIWLSQFRRHGVVVSMDGSKAWEDGCCKIRVAKKDRSSMPDTGSTPPTESS